MLSNPLQAAIHANPQPLYNPNQALAYGVQINLFTGKATGGKQMRLVPNICANAEASLNQNLGGSNVFQG